MVAMPCKISFTLTLLVLYAPLYSALTDCHLNCPNGLAKDADGCEICQCKACDPDPCSGMICLYGKTKDEGGCNLCACNEPCSDVRCPEGHSCQVVKNATTNTYTGQCVPTVTSPPPCQPVTCSNVCPYGFNEDYSGCQTCDCHDPCQNHPCGVNQRCVVDDCFEKGDCRDYATHCDDTWTEVIHPPPKTELTGEDHFQEAMRQCCANASLSDTCFGVCLANATLFLSKLSSCFPFQKIWDYLRCISGSQPSDTILKPPEMNVKVEVWAEPIFRPFHRRFFKLRTRRRKGRKSSRKRSLLFWSLFKHAINEVWPQSMKLKSSEAEKLIKGNFPNCSVKKLKFVPGVVEPYSSDSIPNSFRLYIDHNDYVVKVDSTIDKEKEEEEDEEEVEAEEEEEDIGR